MNKFVDLMERVENPGTFSVSGKLTSIPPGLKVKGVGMISLPFLEQQAEALIKLSEQAPFGRGEETVLDTKIRNTWQLSPTYFELTNPEWKKALKDSIQQIGKQLGLDGCKINFEPYKLLVYEKGSFFTAHRDTEKMPNMFATLVINLPSEHEGGELIVSHGGQSQHYVFADSDNFSPDFVAFYADCYHEVKPVTAGYRICLIYNLAIANRKAQPLLSEQLSVVGNVNQAIREWSKEDNKNPILTYLLEHSYSEKNLRIANLKNGDFAKASVLLDAAEKNDCQAFLCLVTYYRSSYGETSYYSRYDHDLDESDFEEYDVDSEETYAHCFQDSQGKKIDIGKLYLGDDEILASIPLRDGPGRDVSISEATGNEGATKELWYHRGAVILWQKHRDFDLITKMDINYGMEFFKDFIKNSNLSEGDNLQKITRLAEYIIEKQPGYSGKDISQELIAIGNIELLKKFINKHMKQYGYSISYIDAQAFMQIVEGFGWQHFEEELSAHLLSIRSNKGAALQWMNELLLVKETISDEGQMVMKKWLAALWQPSLEFHLTKKEIVNVIQLVASLKAHDVVDEIIAFLSPDKGPEFLTATYGPAVVTTLEQLKGRDYDQVIINKYVEHIRQWVQTDFPSPPNSPKDWFREGSLKCDCKFCTQINEFLPDPVKYEMSFNKTLKRNIVHIQSRVEQSGVDLDVVLVRTPPKFQGDIRKTQKKYDHKRKLFDDAQDLVKALGDLSGHNL